MTEKGGGGGRYVRGEGMSWRHRVVLPAAAGTQTKEGASVEKEEGYEGTWLYPALIMH
jgi:hypothetical protein